MFARLALVIGRDAKQRQGIVTVGKQAVKRPERCELIQEVPLLRPASRAVDLTDDPPPMNGLIIHQKELSRDCRTLIPEYLLEIECQ